MSQHDMVLDNASGAAVRADANNALQALASRQSGASAPGTTYAHMLWVDTTNGVVKRRNAANSDWIIDGTVVDAHVAARSSNTILGVADHGRTIVATSSFTQTLTAAATLGSAWWVEYRNSGDGIITLDPDSTELIDGVATLTLGPGESCIIKCDGSGFHTIGLAGSGLALIQRQSVSAVAAVEFTTGFDANKYDGYVLTLRHLVPATDNVALWLRVSDDGGSTFEAGASAYRWARNITFDDASNNAAGDTADAQIAMASALSNNAANALCGAIELPGLDSTASAKPARWQLAYLSNAGRQAHADGAGVYFSVDALNGLQVLTSSGNITSGVLSLYGRRRR